MCDLQGTKLKLLTSDYWPDMFINKSELTAPKFDGVSPMYNITQNSRGFLKVLLETLALACNFTFELYMRKDGQDGDVRFQNGTLESSGFYENLLQTNLYDGIWFVKTMRLRRMEKVKELEILKKEVLPNLF